jgi:hypothetical protein
MTPSAILHIAVCVTLCEAYMGIEPHLNLWNYFFCVRLRSGSDAEAVVWGCANISVRSRPWVDPYFHLSMSIPPVGWWKELFFLRNDAGAPLPVFTGKRPVPQPNWDMGWLSDTCNLQPLCDIGQRLLRDGMTSSNLLRTLVNRRVHSL